MKKSVSLLEKAIAIAVKAHAAQKDRYGAPYILHPLRMMCQVETDEEKITAVLHDVVEDTEWTFQDLARKGFPRKILKALDSLTKREGEPYDMLVGRAENNSLARRVKLADLRDNMDLRRVKRLGRDDIKRFNKYLKAFRRLNARESSRLSL
jgi:(p)ppGpp synthase/HD superfamily hydrolase